MIKSRSTKGYFLIQTLVFGMIAVLVIGGLVSFAGANIRLGRRSIQSEQAFENAESGLEYYRWHLAHAPTDYTDGTGNPGPITKNITNASGTVIGTFTLVITQPPVGSTLVTIESTGKVTADPTVKRTILSKLAVPSFANFAAVTDNDITFGQGTEVFGPIHSNGGIRFDGLAHNLVTSAISKYDDPDHNDSGTDKKEFGVHTHVNPPPGTGLNNAYRPAEVPPAAVQARSDVFMAGRSFPAPTVDFGRITTDLDQMKIDAETDGLYFASSSAYGYRIVLKTDNTFDLYTVTALVAPPYSCTNTGNQSGWGTWSVETSTFIDNYTVPENGLVFLEDHVWVEGQIDHTRITIVAAKLPDNSSTRKSITINNDVRYTNYDGTDVIALIAQDDVNVGMVSGNVLRIDAALVAQNGRVGRYYYESDCYPYYTRNSITLYGTIVTAQRYGFAYSGSASTGYEIRNIIYDAYLLYSPPPSFPKIDSYHEVIFWKEI